ncbi:MAG: AAA family ATPase [Bacteroidales bacterium]|nr:AAA family ATPase [Bacteroidales bacterium]
MKLKKLRIENFRGYKDVTINFSDFNCIVGKNDVGKSTIFKALEKFFDYRSDIDEYDYYGIFEKNDFPNKEKYPVDITVTIESPSELLPFAEKGNEPNFLTVKKSYAKSPTSQKYKYCYYIIVDRTFFGENFSEYIAESNRQIKKDFSVADYKIRKGEVVELLDNAVSIPVNAIRPFELSKLFGYLPKFKFLTSETPLPEIQELYIKKVLSLEFDNLSEKINGLTFSDENNLRFNSDSISLSNGIMSAIGNKEIPLENRGEGFQLEIRNSIFQKLSELDTNGDIIFAFEEPEAHLHPEKQEEAYEMLKKLTPQYQVMITTHSPTIVSLCSKDEIIQVVRDNDTNQTVIRQKNNQILNDVIKDLGVSNNDLLASLYDSNKCLLLVEGPDDVVAYTHTCNTYKGNGKIAKNFEDLGCVLIPIGGCDCVKHWKSLDIVRQLNKKFFIVLDNDNGKNLTKLQEEGFAASDYHILKKLEIENYIPCRYFQELPEPIRITYGDWDDVKAICKRHPLSVRLGGKKVCEKHFHNLSFTQLRSTFCPTGKDTDDEFLEIYHRIEDLCK